MGCGLPVALPPSRPANQITYDRYTVLLSKRIYRTITPGGYGWVRRITVSQKVTTSEVRVSSSNSRGQFDPPAASAKETVRWDTLTPSAS